MAKCKRTEATVSELKSTARRLSCNNLKRMKKK
jgi:hypothetical protein